MCSQPTIALSDTVTVFHFFPKLPIEARIMIWEFALTRPRIVPLIQRKLKDIEEVGTLVSNTHAAHNRYGFESFGVASRFYSKTFSSLHVDEPHNNSSKENCAALPQTYFDFANDILFPDTHYQVGLLRYNFMPRFLPEETAKVRNLAIMARDTFVHRNLEEYLSRLLNLFSGVENLFVIIERPWILEIEKYYTLEESCELEFLNTLIDIPDALAIYDTAVEPEDLKPLLILRDGWIETYDADFKRLQEWNSRMASHSGSSTSWKVPKIEYKIIMSAGLRRELMRKRHEYHLKLRENRRHHGLSLNSMEDYDELNFSPSELDDEYEGSLYRE